MSQVRKDLIWKEDEVLPYIKQLAKDLGYVSEIHIFGSRAKGREVEDGKDWDFVFITPFKIVNTGVWGRKAGYHIDIIANTKKALTKMLTTRKTLKIEF